MWALLLAGAVSCAPMLAVAVVDPFNSQILAQRLPVDRVGEFRQRNVALWAAYDIDRDTPEGKEAAEVLLVGDSRGEQIRGGFNSGRSFTIDGTKVYDLSFGGASLHEMIKFVNHYRPQFKSVRTLVLTLPVSKLVPAAQTYDRTASAFETVSNPLQYLTDFGNVQKSVQWLVSNDWSAQHVSPWRTAHPDKVDVASPACLANAETPSRTQKGLDLEVGQFDKAIKSGSQVISSILEPFVRRMKLQGLDVLFYLPPMSPPMRAHVSESFSQEYEALKAQLAELAGVVEIEPKFVEAVDWSDAVHICTQAALQLLPIVLTSARAQANQAPS